MRPSRFNLVAFAALVVAFPSLGSAQAAGTSARPTREAFVRTVDSLANAAVKNGPVAGLGVAVVKGRDTLVSRGYGYADVENEIPVNQHTVFRIGSVTKQFTSAAVMKLVEQGKVNLDDDITKYLPTLKTHGRKVLVRHLLNHTSGIPSYTDVGPVFGTKLTLELPHDSLLAIVAPLSPMFEPGMGFYYNNTGYYLLGMLIEKVSGKSYGDHLAEQLFKPLQLNGTMYCLARPLIRRRAQGYDRTPEGLVNTGYMNMNLPGAAGALCSTVGDLVTWSAALHAGKVVSAASLAQMTTPVKLPTGRPMSYGYGLSRDTLPNGRVVVAHGGGINGFISQLSHFPADTLTVVVLANTSPAPSSQLAQEIGNAWYGLPLRSPPGAPKDLPLSAAERAKFVGDYDVVWPDGAKRSVRIYQEGEQLMIAGAMQTGALTPSRLRNQGGNELATPGLGRLQFDMVGGNATGFYLARGSRSLEAKKVR